jgi:plasmid stabilization system protein ParE
VRIEQHPAVDDLDLPVILEYIARDDLAAARRVLRAVRATIAHIGEQPRSGVVDSSGMRMLPTHGFRNYLIFYVVGADFVRILYVVHASRNLPQVFAEDPRE